MLTQHFSTEKRIAECNDDNDGNESGNDEGSSSSSDADDEEMKRLLQEIANLRAKLQSQIKVTTTGVRERKFGSRF